MQVLAAENWGHITENNSCRMQVNKETGTAHLLKAEPNNQPCIQTKQEFRQTAESCRNYSWANTPEAEMQSTQKETADCSSARWTAEDFWNLQ